MEGLLPGPEYRQHAVGQVAHEAIPAKPHHIKNTLASETPTTDGERIYAYFGNWACFATT